LYHEEFGKVFNVTDKKDWYKLKKEEELFYIEKGCCIRHIKCPKGSMVFWDSRTIHCGIESNKKREKQNFRSIVYLCYMPRIISNGRDLKKKQNAFTNGRTTTHNPCKIKLFPKHPRTYGG
jgi:hypothetical protein